MQNLEWDNPKWPQSEDEKTFNDFLDDGKGFDALQVAQQAGIRINKRLVSDALDATSKSLAFARQRENEEEIQQLQNDLRSIVGKWGDPHH